MRDFGRITVIVPVYNVEKYIDRCVNSLVTQTYENTEILLIDDGSVDGSGMLCDTYAAEYSNVTAFHKQNGGLSDARNFGLNRATGEYVIFVDSDDWLEPDSLEALYSDTNGGSVDIVIGCAVCMKPSPAMERYESIAARVLEAHRVYTGKEYLTACLEGGALRIEATHIICRREFLNENGLCFVKGLFHEDEEFTPRAFLAADSVVPSDKVFYHYDNTRESSIMNDPSAAVKKLTDKLKIYASLREIYKTVKPRRLRRLLEDDLSWKYLDCYNSGLVPADRFDALCCAYKLKRRLKALLFAVSPRLYRKAAAHL